MLPDHLIVVLIASHIVVLAAGIAFGLAVAMAARDGRPLRWYAVPPPPPWLSRQPVKDFDKSNRKETP